jgi:acetylglutamate kinase
MMELRGLAPRFIRGRRFTDADTLKVVEDVLVGVVNKSIVEKLKEQGSKAVGVHKGNHDVLFAKRYTEPDEAGNAIDFGYVGKVQRVAADPIKKLCRQGCVPVVAPIASDENGQALNCNADDAASKVAEALKAQKLVYLSDVPGIYRDPKNGDSLASSLSRREIKELIDNGVISEGMLPKALECLQAIEAGVKKSHIIDGRLKHSLLLEIFTEEGVGTEVVS